MAELKLSAVWKIEDYVAKCALMHKEKESRKRMFDSDELTELQHASLPGLIWQARLKASAVGVEEGFVGFYLMAQFGSSNTDSKYVWASYTATVLDSDLREMVSVDRSEKEYSYRVDQQHPSGWGKASAFKLEEMAKAVRNDGSLHIRIDLTILNVRQLLECREMLRGLLQNVTGADFEVKIDGNTLKLHKCILLANGVDEAVGGAMDLTGITSTAAFKAFTQAIYFDNWNFLSDVDLTQDVLHLAEKFNVSSLKTYCDESLAEKVNEANALKILTKSAAICNAKKTKAACVGILAEQDEFEESQVWLDFKTRNRFVALEILDVINKKIIHNLKREREAANE